MNICESCIYDDVCGKKLYAKRGSIVGCEDRKPKSRFVELPCDFCKIIVTGTADNPYYQLLYYNNKVKDWSIVYSSYDLANVFRWKQEIEEAEKALSERSKE